MAEFKVGDIVEAYGLIGTVRNVLRHAVVFDVHEGPNVIAYNESVKLVGARPVPPEEALARALFETDPEVLAFVAKHADATVTKSHSTTTRLNYEGAPDVISCRSEHVDESRLQRAIDIAWARDELGRRSFWEGRVREAMAKMGGGR